MLLCPLPNQLSCGARPNLAFDDSSAKIDHRVLTVILRVKVRRSVIVEVHANDDPEEGGDDRHCSNRSKERTSTPSPTAAPTVLHLHPALVVGPVCPFVSAASVPRASRTSGTCSR